MPRPRLPVEAAAVGELSGASLSVDEAGTEPEDRARRPALIVAVVGAVDLAHGRVEGASGLWDERHLEWPRRDDYVLGPQDLVADVDRECVTDPAQPVTRLPKRAGRSKAMACA